MSIEVIDGKKVLPMNGWRTRTLAQIIFGSPEYEDKFYEGFKFIVPAKIIQKLPEFNKEHQEYADSFSSSFIIGKVEMTNINYGMYVSVEMPLGINDMRFGKKWNSWACMIKAEIHRANPTFKYVKSTIGVYWRDVRAEDIIMCADYNSIPKPEIEEALTDKCDYGTFCDNDLVFRILQLHGEQIEKQLKKAGLI
jgi:hypothetical protein